MPERPTATSTAATEEGRWVTLPDPALFPAKAGVQSRPKWYIRLRGFLSLGVLVTLGGVGLALFVTVLLALLAIASIAFLT